MKRFIALLTAMLFVFSACIFAGCGDSKTPIEKEKIDLTTLSNTELLALSFADGFAQDNALTVLAEKMSAPAQDMVFGTKLEINKLVTEGVNMLEDPIKLEIEGKTDTDDGMINALAAELKLGLFGETLPLEVIVDSNGIYATDILGLNDEAIGIPIAQIEAMINEMGGLEGILGGMSPYNAYESVTYWEDVATEDFDYGYANSSPTDYNAVIDQALQSVFGEGYKDVPEFEILYDLDYDALMQGDVQGFLNGISNDPEAMAGITALLEKMLTPITDAISNAITSNVSEDVLKKEVKDVIVDDVRYEGAYVISFAIDGALVKNVIKSAYDALKDGDNIYAPAINNAGINIDEVLAVTDGFAITVNNILSADGESISKDVRIAAMGKTVAYIATDVETKETIKIGMLNEDGAFDSEAGYVVYNYNWDKDNGTEKGVLGFVVYDNTEELVKFEGDFDGDKREGRFSLITSGTEVFGVDYMLKGDDLCGELAISNIAFNENGNTTTLDFELSVAYDIYVEGMEYALGVKGNMEGTEIDMSANMYCKYEDVSVSAPKKYTNVNELNQMVVIGWLSDFAEKYPNVYKILMGTGDMGGLDGGYNDDYSFDMNDYSIDMDDYSIDLDDYSIDMDDFSFDFDY